MRKRNIQVMLYLSSKEYDSLSKKVKKSGFLRKAYIRQSINGYMPKELPPPDYHGMMRELNVISRRFVSPLANVCLNNEPTATCQT